MGQIEARLGYQIPELPYTPDYSVLPIARHYPRLEVANLLGCVGIYGVSAEARVHSFYGLDQQLTEVEAMLIEGSVPGFEPPPHQRPQGDRPISITHMAKLMANRAMAVYHTEVPNKLADLFAGINIDLAEQQWPVTDDQPSDDNSGEEPSRAVIEALGITSQTQSKELAAYFSQSGLDFDKVLDMTGDLAWYCFNYGAIVNIAQSPVVASFATTKLRSKVKPPALAIRQAMFAATLPITTSPRTSKGNRTKAVREVYPAGFHFAESLAAQTSPKDYTDMDTHAFLLEAVDAVKNLPAGKEKFENLF